MHLRRIDRRLLAYVAAVEVTVVGVERRGRRDLERPRTDRLGDACFRLEPPAVGAEVDDPLAVILSPWRGHLQARADDQVLPVIPELLQRQRGCTVEIDRQAETRIAKTVD